MTPPLPSQAGRVILITGANTGIGRVTARELARAGAHVILACRSKERAQDALDELRALAPPERVDFLALDLADLEQVREAAASFLARDLPLHALINNAGLAGQRGLTKQGFELAFGVNHLGHFLLTLLLMERLRASAPARIVHVSSRAHYRGRAFDPEAARTSTTTTTGLPEYQDSKLANVLFSAELARRLQGTGVTSYALHPGVVASDIWRRIPTPFRQLASLFMISNEEGALTSLHCATHPDLAKESGLYYDKSRPKTAAARGQDAAEAARLWEHSLNWTGAPDLPPGKMR
jgi:retinol dehydrogenase-12